MTTRSGGPDLLDEGFLREFAERWHAAWNSHDAREVAALCTEDVEWSQSSSPPLPRGYDGAAAIMAQVHRACPDFRFAGTEAPYASFERRKAIIPWRFTGIMTGPWEPPGFAPTGARIEIEGDDHWDFRGGLVSRSRALFDANEVAIHFGAVPPPGSRGERLGVYLQRMQARRMRKRPRPQQPGDLHAAPTRSRP